jgi:hypothetical protein
MATEDGLHLYGAGVPDHDRVLLSGSGEPLAVRRPGDVGQLVVEGSWDRLTLASGIKVDQFDVTVDVPEGQRRSVRADRRVSHIGLTS